MKSRAGIHTTCPSFTARAQRVFTAAQPHKLTCVLAFVFLSHSMARETERWNFPLGRLKGVANRCAERQRESERARGGQRKPYFKLVCLILSVCRLVGAAAAATGRIHCF